MEISNFLIKLCCNSMIIAKKIGILVEKCQITVVVVVGDFGVLTIKLWKLISFTQFGENIFGRSHSKMHKKIIQNLMNFKPVSVRNGTTVISQSIVKIVFFRCLNNLILLSYFFLRKLRQKSKYQIFWSNYVATQW